ncbi:DUF5108 domain-containing protein [Segetibacter sp. 3557_3]|uniref:fasciclin domain-containing protein n=1 Tax=Segetibacter sp. 3557_3 TaxID=2547429 RepID=UPI001058FACD|nr:fasciclin domain-containing protein [Segetibacter sp. 3557_3]TDH26582.1 DUF5108 domain-containing protein [Segetibacter sp. 3557_3]
MMNKITTWICLFAIVVVAGIYLAGCKKQDITFNTTNDVNIVGYLDKNIDSFSLFRQILDRTETSSFLNAYGAYTCFAPTNSGVTTWLASVGAPSVEAADLNTLKELVKFHLLVDTVGTGSFTDGKLPVATMQGQFLITGVSVVGSQASYSVNRQALVKQSNIRVGNGLIHVIDNVLMPAKVTIAKQLEANPDYSIFVQALRETGYYDMLNTVDQDTAKRWKTVIAETNKALRDSGITSYAALKARYSNTGNPANALDSLNLYVAYHILDGIKFLGDIITAPSHLTLQPQEVISVQLINQEVVVNEDVFDEKVEPGILLIRNTSDNSATNGVWHTANAHFAAKFRKPTALYWDVAAFDEIRKLTAYYRKQSYPFTKQNEADRPIKDIDWEYKDASRTQTYEFSSSGSVTNFANNQDVFTIAMGPPNRSAWVEFKTPVIIKGRYKVWVCYRVRTGSGTVSSCDVKINGETMQRPVNFTEFRPAGSDAELESLGWKRYIENTSGNFTSRMVGIVDIKTTERHTFRLEPKSGSGAVTHIDMVHFIPIDENQILPRFRPDGTKIFM